MNEKLIEYIRKNLEAGYSKDAIMHALLKAGYNINAAEEHIGHALSLKPQKHFIRDIKQKIDSNSEKYFVVALVAILLITVSVSSFNYFIDLGKEKDITGIRVIHGYNESENLNLFNKALISNDAAICDEIEDNRLKNECRNRFVHNESVCDENCENAKILNLAIIKNNESLCMNIINESLRQDCSNAFYRDTEKTIEDECGQNCLDERLLNLALIRNNESICLDINNIFVKNQCEDMFKKEVG